MTSYSAAGQLDLSDIISWEGSEDSSALRCSHKPSVVTFLHDVHHVSLAEIHLVVIHRFVVVKGSESDKINIRTFAMRFKSKFRILAINSRCGLGFPGGHRGSWSGEVSGERGVGACRARAEDGLLLLIDGDVGARGHGAVLEDRVCRRGSRGFG